MCVIEKIHFKKWNEKKRENNFLIIEKCLTLICTISAKNGSGPTETKQWQDMIAKPRQSVVVWHRLKPGD